MFFHKESLNDSNIKSTVIRKLTSVKCLNNPTHGPINYICCEANSDCQKFVCMDCCKDDVEHITNHGKQFIKIKDFIESISKDSKTSTKIFENNTKNLLDKYDDVQLMEDFLTKLVYNYFTYIDYEENYMKKYLKKIKENFTNLIDRSFNEIESNFTRKYNECAKKELDFIKKIKQYSKMTCGFFNN